MFCLGFKPYKERFKTLKRGCVVNKNKHEGFLPCIVRSGSIGGVA